RVRKKMFAAIGDPFDRLAQLFGSDSIERILAIGKKLGTESAANVVRNDAHLLRRQLHHHAANNIADDVAALAADGKRITISVVFGENTASIEIIGYDALVDEAHADGVRCLGENG